jgi:hypothetical protein
MAHHRVFSAALLFALAFTFSLAATARDPLTFEDRAQVQEALAEDSPFSGPARREAYREAVLRVMDEFHLPGVVAGVWVPGKKPWTIAQGLGDVGSGTPIGLDDHFPIRSRRVGKSAPLGGGVAHPLPSESKDGGHQ